MGHVARFAVILAFASVTFPALGLADELYSHADCISTSAGVNYSNGNVTAGSGGATIRCPIDRAEYTTSNLAIYAAIAVYDSGASNVDCTLFSYDADGDVFDSDAASSDVSGADDVMGFDVSAYVLGPAFISCSVPQNSSIENYYSYEYAP